MTKKRKSFIDFCQRLPGKLLHTTENKNTLCTMKLMLAFQILTSKSMLTIKDLLCDYVNKTRVSKNELSLTSTQIFQRRLTIILDFWPRFCSQKSDNSSKLQKPFFIHPPRAFLPDKNCWCFLATADSATHSGIMYIDIWANNFRNKILKYLRFFRFNWSASCQSKRMFDTFCEEISIHNRWRGDQKYYW